jgi:hypothetical protein
LPASAGLVASILLLGLLPAFIRWSCLLV